jgi:hypothetical protein
MLSERNEPRKMAHGPNRITVWVNRACAQAYLYWNREQRRDESWPRPKSRRRPLKDEKFDNFVRSVQISMVVAIVKSVWFVEFVRAAPFVVCLWLNPEDLGGEGGGQWQARYWNFCNGTSAMHMRHTHEHLPPPPAPLSPLIHSLPFSCSPLLLVTLINSNKLSVARARSLSPSHLFLYKFLHGVQVSFGTAKEKTIMKRVQK